ncbi:MAG TPA: ATP-binding protein [Longimicrobiales bacterium]
MGRGISLRALLVALTLGLGLLVLLMTMSGAEDALRAVAPALERNQREVILDSMHSTQFTRGLIGLIVACLVAAAVGGALQRMFRRARSESPGSAADYWVLEAGDAAEARVQSAEDAQERHRVLERRGDDLDRLLESVSDGILQVDVRGHVVRANRAARRLLQLPDDVEGRQVAAVVRSAELRSLLQRAAATDAIAPSEIAFDDTTLVVTARRLRARDGTGEGPVPAGLAVAIVDLTAMRRLEAVRRDFVANASHELKTPLTSIRGYAETLRDDSLPGDMRHQFIDTIANNAERLQRIVDDLLDLSRLESGTWQPVIVAVDVVATAREAWADFEAQAAGRHIAFDVLAESPQPVASDASALRLVLSNLFSNAIRYTPPGGRIEVRVRERRPQPEAGVRDRRARFAAIEVRDTGSGIPLDALPRIFERFYRVDPARSRAEGGTGLGLSIVKHMVETMGGAVEAESQLGAGTTIRVVLPVAGTGGAAGGTAS